ncbi:MAG: hypothetical protein Q8922_08235 [Bacteroidota bacterium]|nr:hypothetical protein [Bacteroidota bacterium]MDP4233524.1 hypothetical protein [Bacteroidota bacterium]MDP4243401.1 hypothetical protein [Bacteroidota bacterium]MDP4287912.1 hypothetical protein [Bacteroidota bacterium]
MQTSCGKHCSGKDDMSVMVHNVGVKSRRFILCLMWLILASSYAPCRAQVADTTLHRSNLADSVARASFQDSVFGVRKNDSVLHVGDIALQFLAGEAAFNITSFSLWGNDYYRISSDNKLGSLGIMASQLTVPLAIYFTSELLDLKEGSLLGSIGGAVGGALLVSIPMLLLVRPPTYLSTYLIVSLPIITIAQLVYDLTMRGVK